MTKICLRHTVACLLACTFLGVGLPGAPAHAQGAGRPTVVLDGKGWGHGVGLSQWGAKYMADGGATHEAILSTFYPGTQLTKGRSGTVRVAVYSAATDRVTLTFPSGGVLRSGQGAAQAPGFAVQVAPGGSAVVTYDGSYHVTPDAGPAKIPAAFDTCSASSRGSPCPTTTTEPPTTTTTNPPPSTTQPPPPPPAPAPPPPEPSPPPPSEPPPPAVPTSSTPIWASGTAGAPIAVPERGRRYRGSVEVTADSGSLRLVNQLDVETYLKGMAEVPDDWPAEAIEAQADAARTYALRAAGELCDDDHCQVYVGVGGESASQNAAVDATAGEVVTYAGALADTYYCADAGGVTATTTEGFGTPGASPPYLSVVRYPTPDPLPWRAELALDDIAATFMYAGTLTGIRVGDRGPSGRALTVVLDGSAGPMVVDGRQFADKLDLKSTLFEPSVADGSPAARPTPPSTTRPGGPSAPPALHTATGHGTNPLPWIALPLVAAVVALAVHRSRRTPNA